MGRRQSTLVTILSLIGSLFLLVIVGLITNVWAFTYYTDDIGGVRYSDDLEPFVTALIRDDGILDEGERIEAYYDLTLGSDFTEAIILTSDRVIEYDDDRERSISYSDIVSLERRQTPAGTEVSVYDRAGVPIVFMINAGDDVEGFLALIEFHRRSSATAE